MTLVLVAIGAAAFDHAAHFEKVPATEGACLTCHTEVDAANVARPGTQSHSGCDAAECHAKDFYARGEDERPLCRVCHQEASPWADMRATLPFPRPDTRDYCIAIDHKAHLQRLGPEGCQACHVVKAETRSVAPITHDTCDGCHKERPGAGEAGVAHAMTDCAKCHVYGRVVGQPHACSPWRRGWEPVHFPHDKHRQELRSCLGGKRRCDPNPMSCGTCHTEVESATSIADIKLLKSGKQIMNSVCRDCHRKGQTTSLWNPKLGSTKPDCECGQRDGKTAFNGSQCATCHPADHPRYRSNSGPKSH